MYDMKAAGIHTGGGEDLGYPPKSISPPKNQFSIDIIWHNYKKIRLFYNFYNFYIWQGHAYALKSDPELSQSTSFQNNFLVEHVPDPPSC